MRRLLLVAAVAGAAAACSAKEDGKAGPPPPCLTDTTEPNETAAAATSLGEIHDDDVILTKPEASPTRIDRTFSTHEAGDVDWYVVDVSDTGLGGNPSLRVIVGEGHEATAFFRCTSGTTKAVVCGLGTRVTDDPDLADLGCATQPTTSGAPPQLTMQIECDGTSSDDGRMHIRVRKTAATATCERYRLVVTAE